MPLLDEEDDDIPLLGRTQGRPEPLPMDGFQEVEEMSIETGDASAEEDDLGLSMQDILANLGDLGAEDLELEEEVGE